MADAQFPEVEDSTRHPDLDTKATTETPQEVTPDTPDSSRASDVDTDLAESEAPEDPFKDLTSHFLLTSGDDTLIDHSVAGYKANVFGAEVYGQMLKVWGSQNQTGVEILIRLNQVALPGSVTPGSPGGDAWVVVLLDGQDAYVTQLQTGQVVVETCPDTPGMMVTGSLQQLVLFTTTGVGYQTLSVAAEFEVVLGAVYGAVPCTE
ncbi:MAG: hypothetical protein VX938_00365 [Myxococcota bacterium]|nr:hypothetical protein [Myxococcota bacterium]